MRAGLKAIGIESHVTSSRKRFDEGLPILLGTSSWRDIEQKPFLLVDRCSFGNTNEWVSLVWNGHGRRGDHCVRHVDPARWEKIGVEVHPWQDIGKRIVLCGQCRTLLAALVSDDGVVCEPP